MRIKSVLKLHTANKFAFFGLPFMIMGIAFSVMIAIGLVANYFATGADVEAMYQGMTWNGAVFSYLGPLMGFGLTAMGQYFALATGLGLTRKEFAAGTAIVFGLQALLFGTATTIGKAIEVATGGWWLSVRFFDVNYTGLGPVWHTMVQTTLLIAMLMFFGAAVMTAFFRWGQTFLWLFIIGLAVIMVAVVGAALLWSSFASLLFDIALMGWVPWMGVVAALIVVFAAIWFVLVRRTQVR